MRKFIFLIFLLTITCFTLVIANPEFKPQRITISNDYVPRNFHRFTSDGRQSPGVQVGTTTYDIQRYGSHGQRLAVDDSGQIHVNWTYCSGEYPGNPRFVQWNFRYPDGSWHGEADAAPSVSGYCQLDIMIGDSGLAKRTMNTWHYAGRSWTSIDSGSGWGSWPGDTGSPHVVHHIWPVACVASNNNIIMATDDSYHPDGDWHHLYLTTDEGQTWIHLADFDSCLCISQFVRASRNPSSHKVVHAWTQSIALDYPGTLISTAANDIWYMLSRDNGVTWGPQINVTNYLPPKQMVHGDSSPWAYCDVNAVFDKTDKLHIAWGANLGYQLNDTLYFFDHSKIFHWDEVSDTITIISSPSIYYDEPGGWWLDVHDRAEVWQMPADQPQLVVDPDGYLYCLWRGHDDTTDYSASGFFNSEICAAYSTDNGITWSDYVNLTNTRSPGADSGECFDEDYMTAWPQVVNDSIYITYIEDKDAGSPLNEGTAWTVDPVRVWIFHKGLILGTEEQEIYRPEHSTQVLEVYPNPFRSMTNIRYWIADDSDINIKIYDITGKLVKDFKRTATIVWDGTDNLGKKLPSGVYFLEFSAGDYTETKKLILLR
jgi:hypothetical protein